MLRIAHSGLEVVPNMNMLRTDPTIIAMIDFDSNKIRNITSSSLKVKAENLILDHNEIEVIEDWSFHDSQIANLSLKGNRNLRIIGDDAFTGLKNLRTLDLSDTSLLKLPTRGLDSLEVLKIRDTFSMREFPSVLHFPEIREAHLTYPYHCCAFQFPVTHDPREFERLKSLRDVHRKSCDKDATEQVTTPAVRKRFVSENDQEDDHGNQDSKSDYGHFVYTQSPEEANESVRFESGIGQLLGEGSFLSVLGEMRNVEEDNQMENGIFHPQPITLLPTHPIRAVCGHFARHFREVTCLPAPDAFSPCEDVMGHWALRGAVWVVGVLALLGNLAVLTVIVAAKSTMTVSKFLMCHLAFADLCMGLYLLIIAGVDARTMGSYFNHAIDWQNGPGCQLAGFLTVFSSELSVFTLTVITLERWYAITYAIHLNRRLHLGAAGRVMAVGWVYAASAALAPLLGVSGYSRTSICLPMENRTLVDVVYLVGLLTVKGVAFFLICICYLKMYLSIRSSSGNRQAPDLHANRAVRSDLSVAKRMAMLVFTDFFCWAPIAFFGLTALIGHPLIDVTRSKILLVTFYPLNSCANPFLYAILTKQYRRDTRLLLAGLGIVRRRSVHGRTLSTNVNPRRLSSVKALYRGSLGHHHRQHIVLSSGGNTAHRVGGGDFAATDSRTPNFSGVRKDETLEIIRDARIRKGSPAVHRGSPHPIRNNFTKVQHPDQQIILRRVLEFPASSQVATTTTTSTDVTCQDEDSKDTAV